MDRTPTHRAQVGMPLGVGITVESLESPLAISHCKGLRVASGIQKNRSTLLRTGVHPNVDESGERSMQSVG